MSGVRTMIAALLLGACGCHHYVECRNCNADFVDEITERPPRFDWLYHAPLDVSRAGQPDWCRWKVNRWLHPDVCRCHCRTCRSAGLPGGCAPPALYPPWPPTTGSPLLGTANGTGDPDLPVVRDEID